MAETTKEARDQAAARFERAQRAAADGAAAMAEHHANATAVDEKTARLKAARLAKAASDEKKPAAKKPAPKKC